MGLGTPKLFRVPPYPEPPPCVMMSDYYGEIGVINADGSVTYTLEYQQVLRRRKFLFKITGLEAIIVLIKKHLLCGGIVERNRTEKK